MNEYPVNPPPQPPYPPYPTKDRGLALVIEILPALFGFLGFGWIYAGNVSNGVAWLIGGFVWGLISVGLAGVTAGFSCCLTLPVSIGLIALSARGLGQYMRARPHLFKA